MYVLTMVSRFIIKSLRSPVVTASALAVLLMLSAGCDQLFGPSELERQIGAEQSAIQVYSKEVPEVDALQAAFVAAWTEAAEIKDVAAFKEAFESGVTPALESYVKALGAMPTETDELTRIHEMMVTSYAGSVEALRRFTDELDADTIEERYVALLAHMDQILKGQEAYRDTLKIYYARNHVRLTSEPQ